MGITNPYTGGGGGTGDCEGSHTHRQMPAANDTDGSCFLNGVEAPCGTVLNMVNHGAGSMVDLNTQDVWGRPLQKPIKDPEKEYKELFDALERKGEALKNPVQAELSDRTGPATGDDTGTGSSDDGDVIKIYTNIFNLSPSDPHSGAGSVGGLSSGNDSNPYDPPDLPGLSDLYTFTSTHGHCAEVLAKSLSENGLTSASQLTFRDLRDHPADLDRTLQDLGGDTSFGRTGVTLRDIFTDGFAYTLLGSRIIYLNYSFATEGPEERGVTAFHEAIIHAIPLQSSHVAFAAAMGISYDKPPMPEVPFDPFEMPSVRKSNQDAAEKKYRNDLEPFASAGIDDWIRNDCMNH